MNLSGEERQDRFAGLCREFGLVESHREETPYGTILVAEAFHNHSAEHDKPAWVTLWLLRRGGHDDVARRLYFDLGKSTAEGRKNAAIADAHQFVRDGASVGYLDR